MKYLLDTHIFLWWVLDSPKLNNYARKLMIDDDADLFLSAASAWEMAIKAQIGKLTLPESVIEFTRRQLMLNEIRSLDITTEHALTTFELPVHHKDPFDRILIAQAIVENMVIITNDAFIKLYEVRVAGDPSSI
ncbi:type II toxin-antitoxin system VapC family toxin [Desulfobacterales bacterium HSG16]|nr:type II toxin-antitoxin system VapC family toxin [Desulfobacterales bacterium HSG16]